MIAEAYGIKLLRLTEEYLELVRQHRNSDAVRNTMEYREIITPEMQREWFRKIDNEHNNYGLIFVDDKPIGLISGTEIDWKQMITGNGGIFIWDENFKETLYPAKAALLMTDWGFYVGMEKNYVRILSNNTKSIAFNLSLGYQLLPNQEDVFNQQYELTAKRYFSSVEKVRKALGAEGIIHITLDDIEHPSSKKMAEVIQNLPAEKRAKFKLTIP